MEVFKLVGVLAIENAGANKAIDETTDKAEKSQSKLSKIFSGIGKGILGVGKVVATGIGVGVGALSALTGKAVAAAGELEQNMGGSEAVFGEYASKMQENAKKAFNSMGLSASDYLATANKMGSLFKGAGFDTQQAMDMSSKAMQRAADVASIMGLDTSSAMEAIAGAAKGNFTMMDNLGVAINDTTLQAYAQEKGLGKLETTQQKVNAAIELFMEKTEGYAGNYTKENETIAGSMGTAKAAFENFISGVGSVDDVIASVSGAAQSMIRQITDLFPKLTSGITQMVQELIPMIPPLLEQLLPALIQGTTDLINGLVAAFPSIMSALLAAVPALIDGIMSVMNVLIEALPSLVEAIVAALPTLLPVLIDGIVSVIVTLCTMLPQIIQPIIDYLPDIIISVVGALMDNLPALIQGLISLVLGIVKAIPQIIQALVDATPTVISMVITGLLEALPQIIAGLIQVVFGIVKALPQIFKSLREGVINVFKGIWDAVKNVFASVKNWFGEKFSGARDGIKNAFSGIKNFFSNIKNGIVNAFSNIKEKLSAPFTKARDVIKGIADKIKGFFKGEIKMPKLKLPHFKLSPAGWKIGDLFKGSIPKLSIDWYKKAMDDGMILDDATIFGMNSAGQLMGGGEAGSETVVGTESLLGMINGAVKQETSALSGRMDRLLDMLATYFPQMLELAGRDLSWDGEVLARRLAPAMNTEFYNIGVRSGRGG